MPEYWSKKAKSLVPYMAGEQPMQKLIKLNTNENAYPPSPAALHAIQGAFANLRLYPRPDADAFREAAAKANGIAPEQVFCANGSDEALALCFQAFFDPGVPIKTMDVTYSFYPVWAQLYGLTLDIVPLKEDFSADIQSMEGAQNVVLANPNAPTGIALPTAAIERIVQSARGAVIVDEAYFGFGAESAVPLIHTYKNLVVVRTLSKSHSLAGLRAGYVAADEDLIRALTTVKDSFNSYPVDMLAQAGAAAALEDTAYYKENNQKIIDSRAYTVRELQKLGLSVLPSAANFLFVKCADAAGVFAALREWGILVRYFPNGRTADFLRVTIGTREQMEAFVAAMKGILHDNGRGRK